MRKIKTFSSEIEEMTILHSIQKISNSSFQKKSYTLPSQLSFVTGFLAEQTPTT